MACPGRLAKGGYEDADQQDTDSGLMGTSLPVPKTPKGMDKEEWLARLELAACYRLVDCYGWTSIVYNHITLRVPGTNDFLINPFGLRYDEITASDLIRIDIDGKKISDSPWPVNEAGYQIHSTIHKNRPDLHCVLHTHEPISQGLGATDAEYVPLTQEGCQLYERVGYHAFEGIVLDGSEGPRIVAALGQRNHTLLRQSRLITAGPNAVWALCVIWPLSVRRGSWQRYNKWMNLSAHRLWKRPKPSLKAAQHRRTRWCGIRNGRP